MKVIIPMYNKNDLKEIIDIKQLNHNHRNQSPLINYKKKKSEDNIHLIIER